MHRREQALQQLREELERLRSTLTPQQYAVASARILAKMDQVERQRPRYAET